MSKKVIYLVEGSTGEYSDHTQWAVAAYLDREMAELHARLANEASAEKNYLDPEDNYKTTSYKLRQEVMEQVKKSYDPNCDIIYNGVKYIVTEIPLVRHVDEFRELYTTLEG